MGGEARRDEGHWKRIGNNGGPSGCDAEIQGQIPSFFISEGLEKLN